MTVVKTVVDETGVDETPSQAPAQHLSLALQKTV